MGGGGGGAVRGSDPASSRLSKLYFRLFQQRTSPPLPTPTPSPRPLAHPSPKSVLAQGCASGEPVSGAPSPRPMIQGRGWLKASPPDPRWTGGLGALLLPGPRVSRQRLVGCTGAKGSKLHCPRALRSAGQPRKTRRASEASIVTHLLLFCSRSVIKHPGFGLCWRYVPS